MPSGGGDTLIFSYKRRLGTYFWVLIFLLVFRKSNIFGVWRFCGYFFFGGVGGGGHHNIRLDLGSFLCILGSFLQVKIQNVDILRGF